jgi:hypothetical protein
VKPPVKDRGVEEIISAKWEKLFYGTIGKKFPVSQCEILITPVRFPADIEDRPNCIRKNKCRNL